MSSNIYSTLLQRQIDLFVATFQCDSTSLFKNEQNALIHPGEYGMYRERCFCTLLRTVLTRDCSLSDGFIFSSRDDRTHQCDILVKNALSIPLTDSGLAKFHPVEDVYAVIEMKSNLCKTALTATLRKLAEVKKIGDTRTTRRDYLKENHFIYEPIPTFLVCNKLEFDDIDSLDFDAIYYGIDRKYWHNAILSVEDGLLQYQFKTADLPDPIKCICEQIGFSDANAINAWHHSQLIFRVDQKNLIHNCTSSFLPAQPAQKYTHIVRFLSLLTQAIELSEKYQFDSTQYINF